MVFVRDGFHSIVPQTDIKPHDIDSRKCECGARMDVSEGYVQIVHNSWEDTEKMNNSLETIYGSN